MIHSDRRIGRLYLTARLIGLLVPFIASLQAGSTWGGTSADPRQPPSKGNNDRDPAERGMSGPERRSQARPVAAAWMQVVTPPPCAGRSDVALETMA